MADETHDLSSAPKTLDDLLAACIAAEESGRAIDAESLYRQHPQHAAELREFLANRDQMRRLAEPLQGAAAAAASRRNGHSLGKVRYFGDYELLEEIAAGGMGIVYKARQVSLNRVVAVKMILKGTLASEGDVKRFRAEAEAAANLQHPGIVAIHEVGLHEGQHYFSMDFVEGHSLSHLPREQPLSAKQAAEYVRDAAEAVHYAHQQGTLHRDLKPSNILIDRQGRVRITDFGLAKRIEGNSDLTLSGQILGTPSYMPPEQALGKRSLIGTASDVYSLGAVLYELLAGRPPFRGESPGETLRQVETLDPISPRLLSPATPRDLETICLKCLEKEPHKRYLTAQHLADDLGRFLRHEPILARPISRIGRAWRWSKRSPVVAGLAMTTALVLLLGIGVSSYFAIAANERAIAEQAQATRANRREKEAISAGNAAKEQRRLADNRAAALKKSNEQLAAQSKLVTDQANKLRERQIELYRSLLKLAHSQAQGNEIALADENLNIFPEEFRGWAWRYAKRLCHPEIYVVPGQACLAIDPSGQILATASGNSISLRDMAGGALRGELNGHSDRVIAVAFAGPQRLVSISADKSARFWSIATRAPVSQLVCDSLPNDVAVTRSGEFAAIAENDGIVQIWNLTDGKVVRTLAHGSQDVAQVAFSPDGTLLATGTATGRGPTAVQIWNVASGNLDERFANADFLRLTGFTVALEGDVRVDIEDLEFSQNGKLLAIAQADAVRLIDLEGRRLHKLLSDHFGGVYGLSFSSDGSLISSASSDGVVRVWSTADGRCLRTLPWHVGAVQRVAFSPTKEWVAALDASQITLWNVSQSWETEIAPWHTDAAYCVAFDGRGQRLATGGGRHSGAGKDNLMSEVRVLDVLSGKQVFQADIPVVGSSPGVFAVALSFDGTKVAAAGRGRDLRVWDIATGDVILHREKSSQVNSLAFHPTTHELLVASSSGVEIVDLVTGVMNRLGGPPENSSWGGGIAQYAIYSADGRTIFACNGGRMISWNCPENRENYRVAIAPGAWRLAASNDNRFVALALDTRQLPTERKNEFAQLRDAQSGALIRTFSSLVKRDYADKDFVTSVYGVAFTPDSRELATGSGDKTVRIWDVATGGELLLFPHSNQVFCVAFSPNGRHLASASGHWSGPRPGEVRIWDATLPEAKP